MRKTILVTLTTTLFLLSGIWSLIYISTHGRLTVQTNQSWDSITFGGINSSKDKQPSIKAGENFVRSGSGQITLTKNGKIYKYLIKVPAWLGKLQLAVPPETDLSAVKRANNTRDLHVEKDGQLFSMSQDPTLSSVVVHKTISNFPFVINSLEQPPQAFQPLASYGGYFIGLLNGVEGSTGALVKYDPVTNQITQLVGGAFDHENSAIYLASTNDGGFVFYSSDNFYYIQNLDSAPKQLQIAPGEFDKSDGKPVASFSGTSLYLYHQAQASKGVSQINAVVSVSIYNVADGNKLNTIQIKNLGLSGVSLSASPSNKYLAFSGRDGTIRLYDLQKMHFTQSFQVSNLRSDIFWKDDATMLVLDTTSGLEALGVDDGSLKTVFGGVSSTFIHLEKSGGTVYLTAQIKPGSNQSTSASLDDLNPVLYSANLDTTTSNTSAINTLPYQTDDFLIDTLNNKLFFVPFSSGAGGSLTDPAYPDSTAQGRPVDQRVQDAQKYLTDRGVEQGSVEFLHDTHPNFNLFWAP